VFVTNANADHDLPEILYRGEGKTAHAYKDRTNLANKLRNFWKRNEIAAT
jgi:hypothetical protein